MQKSTTSSSAGKVTLRMILAFLRASRFQKKRTKCTVRYLGREARREVLRYSASRSRVDECLLRVSARAREIPSERWLTSLLMWQSSLRKVSVESIAGSSVAAGSEHLRVEDIVPAKYLSMKEVVAFAEESCSASEEESLMVSFDRSWEMICDQASSASC